MLGVKEIRKLLAVYLAALPTSPDEDAQIWLTSLIEASRASLSDNFRLHAELGLATETG
ncbi:MAG: hypothetical protein IPK73_29965 [Candidatus Obscuribacter sp.]|nr:hypothetical protein [Candidatus Obscuribacter sp.]